MKISEEYIYLQIEDVFTAHKMVLKQSGGLPGVKSPQYLESALEHIQNENYYPTFVDKLTHLVFSVIKFHAFNDGNKRTSIALGAYFLEVNGYDFCVVKFIKEMENIAVWVAKNKIDKDLLKELIEAMILEDDFPESLKIKLIQAIDE